MRVNLNGMLSRRSHKNAVASTHVSSVERRNAVVVSAGKERLKAHIACSVAPHLRVFDMLDRLFLGKDPLLPLRVAIRHASEDDLRDLKARVPKAD